MKKRWSPLKAALMTCLLLFVLAIVTAVVNANTGAGGTPQAILDGFHPGLIVPLGAAVFGIVAVGSGLLLRTAPATVEEREPQLELEFEAA